ncbi:MAG: hypothetical protein HQK66_04540 [Desulfamplus sp.]|nr:hypothetical protein [Desulfamplus sp.]
MQPIDGLQTRVQHGLQHILNVSLQMKYKPYIVSIGLLLFATVMFFLGAQKIIDQVAVIQTRYGSVSGPPDEIKYYHGIQATFIGLAIISGGIIMATIAFILLGLKQIKFAAVVIGISLIIMTLTLFPPINLTTNIKAISFYSASFLMFIWRICQKYFIDFQTDEMQSKIRKKFTNFIIISSIISSILGLPDISVGLMSSLFIFGGILIIYDMIINVSSESS